MHRTKMSKNLTSETAMPTVFADQEVERAKVSKRIHSSIPYVNIKKKTLFVS